MYQILCLYVCGVTRLSFYSFVQIESLDLLETYLSSFQKGIAGSKTESLSVGRSAELRQFCPVGDPIGGWWIVDKVILVVIGDPFSAIDHFSSYVACY